MTKLTLLVLFVSVTWVEAEGSKHVIERRSDDRDPLAAVVEQQAAAIQELQSQVQALQASVEANTQRADKNVAFTARFAGASTRSEVQVAPKGVFRFDDVVLNAGNGYNAHSGVFSAPLSGTYFFLFNFMVTNDESYMQVAIDKSGTTLAEAHADSINGDSWDKGEAHATVHLNAGEEVWVRHNAGGTKLFGGWWTGFTGFLLHAD